MRWLRRARIRANLRVAILTGALLVLSALLPATARPDDRHQDEIIEAIWLRAVARLSPPAERHRALRMPSVVWGYPDQRLARHDGIVRGAYDLLDNQATAADVEALEHEFLHAILFQTEGLAAGNDEARVRALMEP